MKYLIVSDIHGSAEYLELVLNKCNDFDKLIVLGDMLYHGPRNNLPSGYDPKKVVEILNSYKDKIIAIRGNCDAKVDLSLLDFKVNESSWIKYNGKKIFLTHGDEFNKDNLPTRLFDYYMIYGHFHKNEVIKINNRITCINVGSLSIPKDNYHSYAILDNNTFTSYDLLSNESIMIVEIK